jgi:NTE family protein
MRRAWTRRLLRDAETVRRSGTAVTLLAPGAEDLAAMGINMMDASRRSAVLEASLRTTAAALADRADLDARFRAAG